MAVKARFYVQSVEMTPSNQGGKVKLAAVTRGERNADWSKYTPSGIFEMYVTNEAAFEFFAGIVRKCQTGELKYPEVDITIDLAAGE